MREPENLVGQRFGRFVVVESTGKKTKSRSTLWLCKCDCGEQRIVSASNLKSGNSQSCGCIQRGETKSYTRIYRIWRDVKYRTSHSVKGVNHNYYEKGIKMCEEWRYDSDAFIEWSLRNGYRDDLSIDRIDNDGDYSPSNCRWVCQKTQCRNKSTNRLVTYNGETKTLVEWSESLGIRYSKLWSRIFRYGWAIERAFECKT